MYIENNRTKTNATFGELRDGDCFVIRDNNLEEVLCIKACVFDEKYNPYYKAIDLDTGAEIFAEDDETVRQDTPVTKVNAKITF